MNGKIKVVIQSDLLGMALVLCLKLKGETFYNYRQTIVSYGIFDNITKEEFYSLAYNFLSDKRNVEKAGEELMRKTLNDKKKELESQSKDRQLESLLKKLKQPIKIKI